MKRILASLFIITLLLSRMVSITVPENKSVVSATNSSPLKQSVLHHSSSCITAVDLPSSVGMGNEQVRLEHSVQYSFHRIFHSQSNTSRINYCLLITRQKFFSSQTSFLLKSAYKGLAGYYLYHLRKLLI